jgi:hypothetical protein
VVSGQHSKNSIAVRAVHTRDDDDDDDAILDERRERERASELFG